MNSYYLSFVLLITTIVVYSNCASECLNKIDTELFYSLQYGETANILLHFQGTKANVLQDIKFSSRSDRIEAVKRKLKIESENTQYYVIKFLKKHSITHKSFWICNQIYIPEANLTLAKQFSEFYDVSKISRELILQLSQPEVIRAHKNPLVSDEDIPWGVNKIQASAAWKRNVTGKGIIVGIIDTGVRGSHIALQNNHRHEYGWYDATNYTKSPYDDNGHGTHVMGTIVGDKGIGIAPNAKWIACKAFSSDGVGLENDIYECAQFMLCPHSSNADFSDCSMAPHIVSNSWSRSGENPFFGTFFKTVTDAWHAAGIITFFQIGDEGPRCETLSSPGYYENVIAVGATNQNDSLLPYSSRGSDYYYPLFKPDITAPGYEIMSTSHLNDNGYVSMEGTGMACSHAAGVGALMLSLKDDLTFEELKTALFASADTEQLDLPFNSCWNEYEPLYPNNAFGHGRINAYKAIMTLSSGDIIVSKIVVVFWGALGVIFYYSSTCSQSF